MRILSITLVLTAASVIGMGHAFAATITDSTFSGGAGDFVRAGDTDDFYGVVDGTGPVTIGGTTATGVNTGPGVGDWLLQSNIGNVLTSGTVMTTLNVATPKVFNGLATFSFDFDEEGDHEGNDDLVVQIVDTTTGTVLGSKIIGDDQNNSPADKPDSITVDASGTTSLQAQVVYDSGFDTGGQDGEEIQISAQLLSADEATRPQAVTTGWTGVVEEASGGDFYGVLTAVGAGDAGTNGDGSFNGAGEHTNADGVDDSLAWAVGDFVLEGDSSSISFPTVGTTLATMDLSLTPSAADIDLLLSFNQDMEGVLEGDDSLRFEIWDTDNNVLLATLTLTDDSGGGSVFTIGDSLETLSVSGYNGGTNFQARLIYNGGFADGDQEEIQISRARFSATYVPEPSTYVVFGGLALCFGIAGWWRKRRNQAAV